MKKRTISKGKDIYQFSNSKKTKGMLIEKNGKEIGVYPHFKYGNNLTDSYLIELALEFKTN